MKLLETYKKLLAEDLEYNHVSDASPEVDEYLMTETDVDGFRFNNGTLNKNGPNTIYKDGQPIVDFGIGGIGTFNINGQLLQNSIYLQGGYNSAQQKRGYGTLGLGFIFKKLPKIENIILQCYETACPFWRKMGGVEIASKPIAKNVELKTLVIPRESFPYHF